MMTGSDSGFAVTAYGEWHAREIEIFVDDLGFTPAEPLRAATAVTAGFMAKGSSVGILEPGRAADFIAVQGLPLKSVAILQDKTRIRHVDIAGKLISVPPRGYDPRQVTDQAWTNWNDVCTQDRVGESGIEPDRRRLASPGSEM
jgi:hypothetical protein